MRGDILIKRIWDITLTVRDLKRAVDFYENVLGLQKSMNSRTMQDSIDVELK